MVILACKMHVGNLRRDVRITKLIRKSKEAIVVEYGLRKMKNIERISKNPTE